MLFLLLLTALSSVLPTSSIGKACGRLLLDSYLANWPGYSFPKDCTRASSVRLTQHPTRSPGYESSLEAVKSLRIIDSSYEKSKNFVSLHIQNQLLVYSKENFLPNLTKIIPAPYSRSSVIYIKDTALCIPEKEKERLLNMVDGNGYIQPCACLVKTNKMEMRTTSIEGGTTCNILIGDLYFNENSTMTEKMRKQLEAVEQIFGRISFERTNFTSLDFIKNLKKVYYWYNHNAGVHIVENRKLKKLDFLLDIVETYNKRDDRKEPLILIEKNPLLNFDPIEQEYYNSFLVTEMDFESETDPIKFDLYPCILNGPILDNPESVESCTKVTGNLTIDSSFNNLSLKKMEGLFGSLRLLDGCLTVSGTQFTNLMFLHDLITIKCKYPRPAVIIENNPELKYLDVQFNDFDISSNPLTIKITNNPKLCFKEIDYLKSIMDSTWRLIEFDHWGETCRDVRTSSTGLIGYFYAVAFGIISVRAVIVEIVIRIVRRRRLRVRIR